LWEQIIVTPVCLGGKTFRIPACTGEGKPLKRGPGYRNHKKRLRETEETPAASVRLCPCCPARPHFVRSLFLWLVLSARNWVDIETNCRRKPWGGACGDGVGGVVLKSGYRQSDQSINGFSFDFLSEGGDTLSCSHPPKWKINKRLHKRFATGAHFQRAL